MNPTLKNVVKAGLLFAAVGVVLALIAPAIGAAVGLAPTAAAAGAALWPSSNPLWLGAFFGAFGAIDAAMRPTFDRIFGDDKAKAADKDRPKITIMLRPAVEKGPEQDVAGAKYRETIEAERTAVKTEKTVTF